jgi:hypothetical protein
MGAEGLKPVAPGPAPAGGADLRGVTAATPLKPGDNSLIAVCPVSAASSQIGSERDRIARISRGASDSAELRRDVQDWIVPWTCGEA